MQRQEQPFDTGAMAEGIRRDAGANLGSVLSQATSQLLQLQQHMDGLSLPEQTYDPMSFDTPEFDSYFAMDEPEFYDPMYADDFYDSDVFFSGIDPDVFAGEDGQLDNSFQGDKEFEEFLKGKKKEYELKKEEQKKLAKKKEEELKKKGIRIVVVGGKTKLVNGTTTITLPKSFTENRKFKLFQSGKLPIHKGKDLQVANWLIKNKQRLEKLGIKVQTDGPNYTIENTKMKKNPLSAKLFTGSGFGGRDFKSFLAGHTSVFNAKSKKLAGWLLKNKQMLEKAGIFVHIELDANGNPKGRFSLQNKKILPKTVTAIQKKALGALIGTAKKMMADAKSILLKSKSLKKSNPAEARKLAKQGLIKLAQARFLKNIVSRFISLSRLLYAKKNQAKNLPANYQTLLKKIDGVLSSAKTPEQKQLALRKATFILDMANTKMSLTQMGRSAILKSPRMRKIEGFINTAINLFNKGTPESFEKAQFLLSNTQRYTSISLERRAAKHDNFAARFIQFYDNVEKLVNFPIFKTAGRFDPKKFQRLTGMSYDDFKTKTGKFKAGFAKVLSHYSKKSMAHYDRALKNLETLSTLTTSAQKPNKRKLSALLFGANKQQQLGRKNHAQLLQVKPLISASSQIYKVMAALPSLKKTENEPMTWGLGETGRKDLLTLRKKVQVQFATTITHLYRASLHLLSSQNAKGAERATLTNLAKSELTKAQYANQRFQKSAALFHKQYFFTKAIASAVQKTTTKAWEDACDADSTVGAMKFYLGSISGRKYRDRYNAMVRRYLVRMITSPNLLATSKWPRGKQLRSHISKYMGWDVFRTFYDSKASPTHIKRAAKKMLNMWVEVESSVIGTTARTGQIAKKTTVKQRLRDHLSEHPKRRPLLKQLLKMEKGQLPGTLDQRRKLLMTFMKLCGNNTALSAFKRVLEGVENNLKGHFRTVFAQRIKYLKNELVNVNKAAKRVSTNGTFILKNLRPADIGFECTNTNPNKVLLANPQVSKAYNQLQRDAGYLAPIVGDMSEFISGNEDSPGLHKSLLGATRTLVSGVATFHANRQKYIELEERKNKFIKIGTVVGLLIAAPFTAGSTGLAAASIWTTGAAIGAAIPSVYMSRKKYNMMRNDPNISKQEKQKAYNDYMFECVMAGLVVLPSIGAVGRTFAASRGALTTARMFAGLQALNLSAGTMQVYAGTTMICEGQTFWGSVNLAFGVLGVAGIRGNLVQKPIISKPKPPPIGPVVKPRPPPVAPGQKPIKPSTPVQRPVTTGGPKPPPASTPVGPRPPPVAPGQKPIGTGKSTPPPAGSVVKPRPPPVAPGQKPILTKTQIHFKNLETATDALKGSKPLTTSQAAQIKTSYQEIQKLIQSRTKLTPKQTQIYRDFRTKLHIAPGADASHLLQFQKIVSGNQLVTSNTISGVLASRQRLLTVGKIRSLSTSESKALTAFDAAIKVQKVRDLKVISSFNTKYSKSTYKPSQSEISIARSAYERMALLQKSKLTSIQESTILTVHRRLLDTFGTTSGGTVSGATLSSTPSLVKFVNDLRSANSGIRSSATANFNQLPKSVQEQVRALQQHFTKNNLWSARSKSQQLAAALAYAEKIKQLRTQSSGQ